MRNYIEENWKPQFKQDPVLVSLRGQLKHVLESYQKMIDKYAEAEDDSSYEREAEFNLGEKTLSYNEKINDLETRFRVYARHKYHIDLPT